jgi:hypothetical protein
VLKTQATTKPLGQFGEGTQTYLGQFGKGMQPFFGQFGEGMQPFFGQFGEKQNFVLNLWSQADHFILTIACSNALFDEFQRRPHHQETFHPSPVRITFQIGIHIVQRVQKTAGPYQPIWERDEKR